MVAFGRLTARRLLPAAQAEVYTDPMAGGVMLEGFQLRPYRRGAAGKLSVDVHVFKVGSSSRRWTYILDAASPEAKQADLYWLSDLWQRHVADIAAARG